MRTQRGRLLGAVVAVLLIASPLIASQTVASDHDLARSAAAAVRGRVASVVSGWDGGAIYTWVTVEVERAWGLETRVNHVVVKQLGGVAAGTALVVGGQAQFVPGEQVFLLLAVRPRDRTLTVAGLGQGKWSATRARASGATWRREAAEGQRALDVSTDRLDALAATVGTRTKVAGADLAPASPAELAAKVAVTAAGIVGRWHEADDGHPVFVDREPGGLPAFRQDGHAALDAALAVWSEAGSLQLLPGASRGPRCFSNLEAPDGRISVTHGDPCDEIPDASPILAIGGAYFAADDIRDVNGRPYWRLTKGMVVTDDAPGKLASLSETCVEDLLAHEIGHAIGLDHVGTAGAVMAPALSPSCALRPTGTRLARADRDALTAAYPVGEGGITVPPASPPGVLAATMGSTVSLAWGVPEGAVATGYEIHAGSGPGRSDIAVVRASSPTLFAPAVGDGVYFVRVVALNAIGRSAPTPDVRIEVDAHRHRTDGRITFSWSGAAPGEATGVYELHGVRIQGGATHVMPVQGPELTVEAVTPGAYLVRLVASRATGRRVLTEDVLVLVLPGR